LGGLPDGKVGPMLEETIPRDLEDRFVAFGGELVDYLPPDYIYGFTELFFAKWKRSNTLSAAGSIEAMTFR